MKNSKLDYPFYWVFFIIWPFFSFFSRLRKKGGLGLYIALGAFFGFTMLQGGDTYSLTNILKEINSSDKTFDYFREMLTQNIDFVYPSILFLVGIFTDDPQILFAFLAVAFVYFIYKLIETIKFQYQYSNNESLRVLLFISIALSIQVWWLAGRWNLAAIVFAYGIFNYFHTSEKKFLIFIYITPLIHWTFVLVIPVFLIYYFLKNRLKLYFYLFILSFFINAITVSQLSDFFERFSTDQIQETRGEYLTDEYIESTNNAISTTNWYVHGHEKLLTYTLLILLVYLYFKKRNQLYSLTINLYSFLCFSLLFYAVFNSLSNTVPDMLRFFRLSNLLFLVFFVGYICQNKLEELLKKLLFFTLVIFIIVRIRIGFDYINIFFVISNVFIYGFIDEKMSIINFIKYYL